MTRIVFLAALFSLLLLVPPGAAAATRELGVDVSHYQGEAGISQASWNQMFSEGKRFAFIKASEGLTGPDDSSMPNNVARASAAGLLVGVYHYAHPENRPTAAGAVQEADHFLTVSGQAIGPGYLRPVLDLEGSSATLSTSALSQWVVAFHDRIVEQRGSGAAPIVYTSRSFAKSELDARVAAFDLWLAYPVSVDPTTTDPPPTTSYPDPTGVFNNWAFWQYSWTGNAGGLTPLDLDVCHSDYRPLSAYLIPSPELNFVVSGELAANGALRLAFANTPGVRFTVLAADGLTAPETAWAVLGRASETAPGQYSFTDTEAALRPQRFYRVSSP